MVVFRQINLSAREQHRPCLLLIHHLAYTLLYSTTHILCSWAYLLLRNCTCSQQIALPFSDSITTTYNKHSDQACLSCLFPLWEELALGRRVVLNEDLRHFPSILLKTSKRQTGGRGKVGRRTETNNTASHRHTICKSYVCFQPERHALRWHAFFLLCDYASPLRVSERRF